MSREIIKKEINNQLNPNISVDCVIFGFDGKELHVLLIDRENELKNVVSAHALPGNLVYDHENLNMAAERVLKELTGLTSIYLEQFGAFGDPDRIKKKEDQPWLKSVRTNPNARVVTIGYYSLIRMSDYELNPSSFAKFAKWIPLKEIQNLPFDHFKILNSSIEYLRSNTKIRPIGYNLLPEKFTLNEMQKLYEAIFNKKIDNRNFRRKIINLDVLDKLAEKQEGVAHKPATFYKFNVVKYESYIEKGFFKFEF
ncbi:MAG: NUDIX domain-containing protein [Flavobacteriales bacterium]|nr:NUDIX domain-containing protein [Flavobacteriales bacterium]MDG1797514.1 NUDIX domain-containing protein [Flavobacteriales bacterium]